MASVYSHELYRVSGQVGADGDVHVDVPASNIMVVRCIDVYTGSFSTPRLLFHDLHDGGTWWQVLGGDVSSHYEGWRGHQVFETEGFAVFVDSGAWDVRVSGYLLQSP